MMKTRVALCALLMLLWISGPGAGFAQSQAPSPSVETLEQEFTDPLTVLPQVFLRDTFTPANFGTHMQVIVWRGWYLKSADAAWKISWRHHSPTKLPPCPGVGRVMVRPGRLRPQDLLFSCRLYPTALLPKNHRE